MTDSLPPIPGIVGNWKSVANSMPDDQITCLVWSETLGDCVLGYHDNQVLESRSRKTICSGWVSDRGRVIPGVTHYCDEIIEPVACDRPSVCPLCEGACEVDGDECAQCLGSGLSDS